MLSSWSPKRRGMMSKRGRHVNDRAVEAKAGQASEFTEFDDLGWASSLSEGELGTLQTGGIIISTNSSSCSILIGLLTIRALL